MANTVIKTQNLSKYYGKAVGIENLNLEVKEGEIFGYLGPNGAGKSTTIKLLLNFIKPSNGSITVFDKNPEKEVFEINKEIGYLPGEVHMYEQLTGEAHLKYQAKLHGNVSWDFVKELQTKLQANFSKPIKALSHGNKQKIALIAAIMSKPRLLILDEPTTGLDPLIQQAFYSIVEKINREGTTVFVSSHILPEIERICHRVAIIREGKLVVTEEISVLKSKAERPVEVFFKVSPKQTDFEKIPELSNLELKDKVLRGTISGSHDKFIKALAKYEILNLITHEPNLEKIFLQYYKGENET